MHILKQVKSKNLVMKNFVIFVSDPTNQLPGNGGARKACPRERSSRRGDTYFQSLFLEHDKLWKEKTV